MNYDQRKLSENEREKSAKVDYEEDTSRENEPNHVQG